MNTIYFFFCEQEYQSIRRLITSFSSLYSQKNLLVYCSPDATKHTLFNMHSSAPLSLADSIIEQFPSFTRQELIKMINELKDQSVTDDIRLCCFANCNFLGQHSVSYYASELISEIQPHSLLLLENKETRDDVKKYLGRELTQRRRRLPTVEMSAVCIDVDDLHQNPIPNLNDLNEQIKDPIQLKSPFFQKNRPITVFIADNSELSDSLLKLVLHDPYLMAIYNEEQDLYQVTQFMVYDTTIIKGPTYLTASNFVMYIRSIHSEHELSRSSLNLVCPVHLGEKNSQSITEVLTNLVYIMKPSSLSLITATPKEIDEAKKYFLGQRTKLGYHRSDYLKKGLNIELSTLNSPECLNSIFNAPDLIKKATRQSHNELNNTRSICIYITHYRTSEFAIDKVAQAFCLSHREPYIMVYFNSANNTYAILDAYTFNHSYPFQLSHEPSNQKHLIELIDKLRHELYISKLNLYTNANLGNPESQFVTKEVELWIELLKPEFLGLLYPEHNFQDASIYFKRGVTAQGYKLPQQNLKGRLISEQQLQDCLSQPSFEPDQLNTIMTKSSSLPSLFKHTRQLSIYIFHSHEHHNSCFQMNRKIAPNVSLEQVALLCETGNQQPSILVYYFHKYKAFQIQQIHSKSVHIVNNHEKLIPLEQLVQLISSVRGPTSNAIRLYSHANLGNPKGRYITPILDQLVHQLTPMSLCLFYTTRTKDDTSRYLSRLFTKHGCQLPAVDMCGAAFNELKILHELNKKSSTEHTSDYLLTLLRDPSLLSCPPRRPTHKADFFSELFSYWSPSTSNHRKLSISPSNRMVFDIKPKTSGISSKFGLFVRPTIVPTSKSVSINNHVTIFK